MNRSQSVFYVAFLLSILTSPSRTRLVFRRCPLRRNYWLYSEAFDDFPKCKRVLKYYNETEHSCILPNAITRRSWSFSDSFVLCITPWGSTIVGNLTVLQLVKNYPVSYENRRHYRFLTACHLFLSWRRWMQFSPNSKSIKPILIHYVPVLGNAVLPANFSAKTVCAVHVSSMHATWF